MEIKLSDFGDGGALTLSGGDLTQDDTHLTAIYDSLFGGDRFYNIYTKYPTDRSFELAIQAPINLQNLKNAENAALNLLRWMVDEGVVESISAKAYGGKENKINVDITTIVADGEKRAYSIAWNDKKMSFSSNSI